MKRPKYKHLSDKQFWILPGGSEVRGAEAYEYLSDTADDLQFNIKALTLLNQRVASLLKDYRPSSNIINDVMNMSELVSLTDMFYEMYREAIESKKLL